MTEEYIPNPSLGIPFQLRANICCAEIFSPEIIESVSERNDRFLEEALELVQAKDMSREEAHWMVDYVFDREKGDPHQELGGVMVTIAVLAATAGLDMHQAGETELQRIWGKISAIRAKQDAKPKYNGEIYHNGRATTPIDHEELLTIIKAAERNNTSTWDLTTALIRFFNGYIKNESFINRRMSDG